jgi:hypothetical protein
MNYQNLTTSELKALLTDRQIPGRSKATTKTAMIGLLEAFDHLDDLEAGKLAAPAPQPKAPAPVKKPAPAPTPIRPKSTPAAEVQESDHFVDGSKMVSMQASIPAMGADFAQLIAQAVAQEVAKVLARAVPAAAPQLAAAIPDGPWLNDAGEFRPDFVDWIAKRWKSSFSNRANQEDWEIRVDVFAYLRKPGKLIPEWVSFENACKERAQKEAISRDAGISSLKPPAGMEAAESISVQDKYGTIARYTVWQCPDEERARLEAMYARQKALHSADTPKISLPFPSPQSASEVMENLKGLTNKFTFNSKPKCEQFSAKHYQDVARNYRARYAVALSRAEEEF